jgi:hypothetical protein
MRARKAVVLLFLSAVFLVAPAKAAGPANGTLSVKDGWGMVYLSSRGTVIGRVERGRITVTDPKPFDARKPLVLGATKVQRSRNRKTTIYTGRNLRLRSTGGLFHIRFQGRGIQLSAVGRGQGLIQGQPDDPQAGPISDGLWSLNDKEYESLPPGLEGFDLVAPPPPPQD